MREVAGEHVLIPYGEKALEIQGMISLSESGGLLWEKLQDGCTEKELVQKLLEEYEVDEKTAVEDIRAFLDKLEHFKIVENQEDCA